MALITEDFTTAYGLKPGLLEADIGEIYSYFVNEYRGSIGVESGSDLISATTGEVLTDDEKDAQLLTEWGAFLDGGDPFGFHSVGVELAEIIAVESSDRLEVIWTLFEKLIDLLEAIQGAAISLAGGVEYKTETQSALTTEISGLDPSADKYRTALLVDYEEDGALNTEGQSLLRSEQVRVQQKIENLRSLRTAERDHSKDWSSSLSTSNEATQGQSQILTTIMQQMSGLISAIFK